MLSSASFPNSQTRDPVLSKYFNKISYSKRRKANQREAPKANLALNYFQTCPSLFVSLLLKPQFHSLEGTERYRTGSQDAKATSSSSLNDILQRPLPALLSGVLDTHKHSAEFPGNGVTWYPINTDTLYVFMHP